MKESNTRKLKKICYLSEAALKVASGVFQWTSPAAVMLGAALSAAVPVSELITKRVESLNKVPTLEEEYFDAVNEALDEVEQYFSNRDSYHVLIQELQQTVGSLDEDIESIISRTESVQTKYMTSVDIQNILRVFDTIFTKKVVLHPQLRNYYTIQTGRNTLDLLKRTHLIISADSEKLDHLLDYAAKSAEDIEEIKTEVHKTNKFLDKLKIEVLKGLDIVTQSVVIHFTFLVASTFFSLSLRDTFSIFMVICASEYVIRFQKVNWNYLSSALSLLMTQTLMIASCAFLLPIQIGGNGLRKLLQLVGCALAGVLTKYALKRLQSMKK